jgi:hypothetical protein
MALICSSIGDLGVLDQRVIDRMIESQWASAPGTDSLDGINHGAVYVLYSAGPPPPEELFIDGFETSP